jgi:choline dehydrogenase-like flavoprotein
MPSRGLVVASRLAENKSISVAVIEAGPNAENLQEVLLSISLAFPESLTIVSL